MEASQQAAREAQAELERLQREAKDSVGEEPEERKEAMRAVEGLSMWVHESITSDATVQAVFHEDAAALAVTRRLHAALRSWSGLGGVDEVVAA